MDVQLNLPLDEFQRPSGQYAYNCWAEDIVVCKISGNESIKECFYKGQGSLGLCERHDAEMRPVRLEPCPVFRVPLEGDLLTCADCGWWSEDHGR